MVLKRKWFVSRSVADDSAMSCFENRKKNTFETPVGGFKKVASLS